MNASMEQVVNRGKLRFRAVLGSCNRPEVAVVSNHESLEGDARHQLSLRARIRG